MKLLNKLALIILLGGLYINDDHALINRKLQEQLQELKHELTLLKTHQ